MTAILDVPEDWIFIGHLCVGYPSAEDHTPALERAGWEMSWPRASANDTGSARSRG